MTFETTSKGKPMVRETNNYTYVAIASSTEVKYWKCLVKFCSARIRTRISSSNLIGTVLPEHLHENRLLKQAVMEQKNSIIKKMAKVDGVTNTRVISEITSNIQRSDTPNLICGMRSKNALKVALWREKRKVNLTTAIPKTGDFASFMTANFPEKFSKTNDGKDFLRLKSWTNEDENEAVLVYISDTGAQVLRTHKVWCMDGTFRTTPSPFSQVYIVMARSEIGGQGLACGFGLLPNKKAETYSLMLNKIFALVGNNSALSVIVCDFEQSVWKSLAVIAPTVRRRGCQFHYRKAHISRLGDLGLKEFYNGDVEFNELVHNVFVLSYVPVEDVVKVYEEHKVAVIEEKIENDKTWNEGSEELVEYVKYMKRTWIGKVSLARTGRRASRRPPIFAHDMWNVYLGILEEDPVVTNNGLESWNRT